MLKLRHLGGVADDEGPIAAAPAVPPTEVFRRFWPWVRPDRFLLLAAAIMLIAGAAGGVLSILLFKSLIDQVLVPRNFSDFWLLGGAMLTVALAAALSTFGGEYTTTKVAERFLLRLRTSVAAHLHTLPPDVLRTRWHGDVVARLTNDIDQIEEFVASGLVNAGTAVVSLLFFSAAAVFISWPLAVTAFALAPIFYLAARAFARRIQDLSREARRREGGVTAVVEESLANAPLAHAYNQQHHEVSRIQKEGEGLLRAELATARVAHLYPALLNVIEVLGGLVIVGLGAFELTRGVLTLGGLLAFVAFMAQLFSPVQELSGLASTFGAASAGAERLLELFRMRSPVTEREGARNLTTVRGEVSCEDVRASYPTSRGRAALEHVTFSVAPGQILGVMGPSGAGKSTLAKLLVRFMDPDAGTVRLDGVDLRDMTIGSVRNAVTLLPQQAQLYHASIRDNIAYGRPDADESEIISAAKDADAHDFITALPNGYDTVIGEDGFQLSGGQAQRVAIARAFLRGTPVLVLDEPTAGLDVEAASNVLAPLRRLMEGRTTILITHDHALARHADAVYVLPGTGAGTDPADETPASSVGS